MKRVRALFFNPNRYQHPPVIPLGVEYLSDALRGLTFETSYIDLCFSDDPFADLTGRILDFRPDVICATVRNIDTALLLNNEYFLPGVRSLLRLVRELTDAPVIVGGAALTIDPEGILDYLGADAAVSGPGEETLPLLLEDIGRLRGSGRVFRGKLPASRSPERPGIVSYDRYLNAGGIPGFTTHTGCTSTCAYCVEAGSPVAFREPSDVVAEIRALAGKGAYHFHLCDAEFNEDLEYCIAFLTSLKEAALPLRWALYMKPGTFNRKLLNLLAETGAYLITLAVDSFRKCPEYWKDVESMIYQARKAGVRVSIDLLTGFPGETQEDLRGTLDFFRRIEPDEVVMNTAVRIYRNTRIMQVIAGDLSLRSRLITFDSEAGPPYLGPVFYSHVSHEELRELLRGDELFRIAGEEKGVNYQRASG